MGRVRDRLRVINTCTRMVVRAPAGIAKVRVRIRIIVRVRVRVKVMFRLGFRLGSLLTLTLSLTLTLTQSLTRSDRFSSVSWQPETGPRARGLS